MSDGSHGEPNAIANDLAIAAKNASAKLRLAAVPDPSESWGEAHGGG